MNIVCDFERKTPSKISKESIELKCGNKVPIYTIESINDLHQFVGYGKYINRKEANIYIRGQLDLYNGTLIPSLYREKTNLPSATSKFYERVNDILENYRSFTKFPKRIFEATIQHYGIKTTQIDIVDNLWIALWFASNEFRGKIIKSNEHLFVSKSDREYGYILLVASDALIPSRYEKGLYVGKKTELIDLRKALPSYYLRPHAQHAYMLRKKVEFPNDYSDLIVGVAKIPVSKIEKWIGNSELLSVSSLFPSACFDYGYEILLKNYPPYDTSVVRYQGSIQIISS